MLGTLVVEIEAEDGITGFAVTTGGEPAAYIVEKHLARFLEGRDPAEIEKIWDQMYFSTQYYGRKGLVINAISGVDLALWDLLGRLRGEPVHHTAGRRGARRAAFSMPPARGPIWPSRWASSAARCRCITARPKARRGSTRTWPRSPACAQRVGPDFWLMLDCWMALDLNYATRLAAAPGNNRA